MAARVFSFGTPAGAPIDDHAHDQHGDDTYHSPAHGHAHDDGDFLTDHHAPRASDAHSNEFAGHATRQQHIDAHRQQHAGVGAKNDLGHPQDRGTTRADAHAHSNRETYGKPFTRGGQAR